MLRTLPRLTTERIIMKFQIGKTYNIEHVRKGSWTAKCVAIAEASDKDRWITLDDDTSSPVRESLMQGSKLVLK